MESPAATAGIYCKACGYDLRGSLEGGRCPECGRVFSPDDPKSFRRHPRAAEWQQALGRWAKRFVSLLLVVLLLLVVFWFWFFWGWSSEQAAIDAMHAAGTGTDLHYIGGPDLHIRLGRAGFVLERCTAVSLATDLEAGARALPPDVALRQLRRLGYLRCLHINSPVTDAGLVSVAPHTGLQELALPGTITDTGLAHLRGLTNLRILRLGGSAVTDAGVRHLRGLCHLRELDLSGTRITDATLAGFDAYPELEELRLIRTPITNAGLVPLARLRALKFLYLQGTRVTPAGVARLKAALPGCTIYYGP